MQEKIKEIIADELRVDKAEITAETQKLLDELERLKPAEIVANTLFIGSAAAAQLAARRPVTLTPQPDETFDITRWPQHLPSGGDAMLWGEAAAGLLSYIERTQQSIPIHIGPAVRYDITRSS